ncbi:hypothetical protein JAGODDHD_04096 [Sphingomonas paucimobilis]|uniref:FG-GAP repeat domain-containing protein n=1 Tax=Sphingomonas paucimobilis TaxID=13689 RepID=UPI002434B29C|nr:VCBS repeat-containing protein [Sphingomonas paucimobilis]MDG5973326.1 hypothetical protein [Sphingomonas paucimobilis]
MANDVKEPRISPPLFEAEVVAEHLRSAYWVEALDLDLDGRTDLVGYGMSLAEIYAYRNLCGDTGVSWDRKLLIDGVKMPVGMDSADISGNGYPDLVVCYDLYGESGTFRDPAPDGGKIDWLENPGAAGVAGERWRRHYVGHLPAMHRLRIGYFTQTERLEIVGFPIVSPQDMHGVVSVVLFTQPDNVKDAECWPMTIVDDSYFRFVHGVEKKANLVDGSRLDSLLIASDEGVTWLHYDQTEREWVKSRIGEGEYSQITQTKFKGSGDADVGRVGENPFAYVAAIEPFHGNTVVVYVKSDKGSDGGPEWSRHLLDIYSDPNVAGESPGHCVVCADFDGDGDDEFLVGLRGPQPWQGVIYYKPVDLKNGIFTKWRIGTESVARIALGDFGGDGGRDFATIGYSIQNYFEAENPKLIVYRNRTLSTDQ